ncbi:hypothetical protein B0T26DRAFT_700289 [Lasiosphaeria miniovina]|uniref:Uncharacterized protein n=1 Tax=Lasiosphaeria miniovina TaxID=1954250 RepID=A0AA40ATL1_9PEZI|nr:uncharacterized protein B0T26DRAFT_700289 [Lasiosphaeria miniovina]KAK0721787.1 hypothetical protein B0T26DRAFT_700289 [Lasiosphaeria miniovina]
MAYVLTKDGFWRPISHNAINWLLVVCDGCTTPFQNLVPVDQVERRLVGDVYYATHKESEDNGDTEMGKLDRRKVAAWWPGTLGRKREKAPKSVFWKLAPQVMAIH